MKYLLRTAVSRVGPTFAESSLGDSVTGRWGFGLILVLVSACDGVQGPADPTDRPVIRPRSLEPLTLATTGFPLPPGFRQDSSLSVAELRGLGTLVGGAGGLFSVEAAGLRSISTDAVDGLAAIDGVGIAVAGPSGLAVWRGTLETSPLNELIGSDAVTALASRGDQLWFATDRLLYAFEANHLSALTGFESIEAMHASATSSEIVVTRTDGVVFALHIEAGEVSTLSLSSEIDLDAAVPGPNGRLLGVRNGALLERVRLEEERATWRPVSLTMDEQDPGATDVEMIRTDPVTGAVWIVAASGIFRLEATRTVRLDGTALSGVSSISAIRAISVTTDGALWLRDGDMIQRIGQEGPPTAYDADIRPFFAANCQRCHVPLGNAHPLENYDAWVLEADAIVSALDRGAMPADGKPLRGGSVDLVRRWRDGGFRR